MMGVIQSNNKQTSCSSCWKPCLLRAVPEKEHLDEERQLFRYSKGQRIFREGMPQQYIGFVSKGKAKVYVKGRYGKTQILRFLRPGDILCCEGFHSNHTPATVEALEATEICLFSRDFFNKALLKFPELSYKMLLFTTEELRRARTRERNMAHMSVKERIADGLLSLYDLYGQGCSKNINIRLSRQEIADYCGTTKEQVSKVLSEYKEDKLIHLLVKEIYILDEARLRAVSTASLEVGR